MPTMGPVQLLIIGFEGDQFTGEIAAELERLRDAIQRAGGMPIADAWLAPEDVASIGLGAP